MNNTEAGHSTDGGSQTKKRKIDYMVDGSIVQVVLKNFMTFSEVTFTAHPKLNLIIGPNGSGKSSIVTALILGFGGNPKDINRGDKVSQFVKSGKDVADISIELYKKSTQNIHLRRTIFVSNEACQYFVNNVGVTRKKYVNVVENLSIKVHNLCQFLPQDRLEDFSKLDTKGLLLNALQSIENQDLLDGYNKLIKLAESMTTFDDDLKKLQNTIRSEISTNAKMETIVNSFTERKLLENQLLHVYQKRSWALYSIIWKLLKNEYKKFVKSKNINLKALNIINQQRLIIKQKKTMENDFKKVISQNFYDVFKKEFEKIYEKVQTCENYSSALRECFKTAKKTLNKIVDYKEAISSMEKKLESIKTETLNVEVYKVELVEINKKIKHIDENIFPLRSDLESIKSKLKGHTGIMYAIDQELDREKRKEDGKNQLLQRKFPEMWKAIKWLRSCDKRTTFRGQVFEPLFTQIEVLDQKNAKYIENIINYRDMIAFVFEYAEDLTTFNNVINQERWQKINSISAPPANFKVNDIPNYDINNLRQFGFLAYALDMINVPPIIKRYLAKSYNMHNIPIGSKEVINHIQKLPNDISAFFAGDNQFVIRTSMYTGEKITRQTHISNEPQFLLFSVNSHLIQSLTLKKEQARAECDDFEQQQIGLINQLKSIEDSRQPFFDRKKEIQGMFMKFHYREQAFNKMTKDVEFTKSELKREEERSSTFSSQQLQLCNKYLVAMNEVVAMLDKYLTCTKGLLASIFTVKNCCMNVRDDIVVLEQLKEFYVADLKNITEYVHYTLQDLNSRYDNSMETALKLTKNVSPYDVEAFAPYKEKFQAIEQSSIDDLDLQIVEKKAKLNCLVIDPNAPKLLNEYKQRKLKIKDMENKLKCLNYNAQNQESEIENIYADWFPKLQELTNLLSLNFQKFLELFGCNGIIDLDIGLTRYDFKAYGLLIKVQFRNDQSSMRLLDAKSQSGGERALTTALFLLALQEITHFPFRIVDEINQGMDKVYERKLMELFMDLFENRNNQYIVVTPKLIKNLSFKNTTVHSIYCLKKE